MFTMNHVKKKVKKKESVLPGSESNAVYYNISREDWLHFRPCLLTFYP